MKFDAQNYPYASKRSVVYAKNGMVCVGNPTAASAGLQTLLKGGNAIDAAITVATCQPVVEPTGNGLGSDCFALIWYKGKLYGINGSGPAPMAASIAALKERGFDKIPPYADPWSERKDRKHPYHQHCWKIPGTFQNLYLRKQRKKEILHCICRFHDQKYCTTCRGCCTGI